MVHNKLLVADLIAANQENLILTWVRKVQAQVPAAEDKSKEIIRDHIDQFFKSLVLVLKTTQLSNADSGFIHGKERARTPGYTLKQLICEYHLLRNVVMTFLDEKIDMENTTRNLIHQAIDDAIADACAVYEEEHDQLHDFIMQAPAPLVILTGGEFKFKLANPPYENVIGRKAHGKNLLEVFSEEEVSHFIPLLQGVLDTGVPVIGNEMPLNIKREDGSIDSKFVNVGYHPYKEEGSTKGILAVVQDVTEQVTIREMIASERLKFESIFMDSPACIALLRGPDSIFEKVNPRYADLFRGRDILNKAFTEALPEILGTDLPEIMKAVYDTGKPFIGKEMLVPLVRETDGPLVDFYFDFTYSQVVDGSGNPYGTFIHAIDVTEKVNARQNLQKAVSARDDFLSIASHELKTPLTSLKLQLQSGIRKLARSDTGPSKEDCEKLFGKNIIQVNRLIRLVDDMLDLSRVQSGNFTYHLKSLNLCDIVKDIHARFKETFENNGSYLELECIDSAIGEFDLERIEQVIINLLTNALKYGEKSAVKLSISAIDNVAFITVKDGGLGIKAENFDKIFQRFERVISANEVSGLGIGLYISKEIVEAHQGRISVASEFGKGSTFSVELPLNNSGNSLQ